MAVAKYLAAVSAVLWWQSLRALLLATTIALVAQAAGLALVLGNEVVLGWTALPLAAALFVWHAISLVVRAASIGGASFALQGVRRIPFISSAAFPARSRHPPLSRVR
jgi:hypothetical protein